MRILICTNSYPPRFVGGAELVAHEQARALARLGHDVAVFAGDLNAPGERHSCTTDMLDGIVVHRICTVPEDYAPDFLNFLHPETEAHFSRVLRDFSPDIVHCHNLMGLSVRLPMLAGDHDARVVCTLHDYWGFCLRNTAMRLDGAPCRDTSLCHQCLPFNKDPMAVNIPMRLRKDFIAVALDHVDRFIAPSRFVADRYSDAGIAPDRISVIPNGIDIAHFMPRTRAREETLPVKLAYVGYLGAHKGIATLLAALALLRPDAAITLDLVGRGPEEAAYRALVEQSGLAGRVTFRGTLPPAEMPAFYAETDILVLPSIWEENQPVCLMEAMACGIPVIASRKGGIPELVTHGTNGLLFEAGDARALANALEQLIDHPTDARKMGDEGRKLAIRLSLDEQAGKYAQLYREVESTTPRARSIVAIVGDYAHMTKRDHRLIDRQHGRYMIPLDWLGADQRQHVSTFAFLRSKAWGTRMLRLFARTPIFTLDPAQGPRQSSFLKRQAYRLVSALKRPS